MGQPEWCQPSPGLLFSRGDAPLQNATKLKEGGAQLRGAWSTNPQAWKEPVLSTRAWRGLGEVRTARGDRAGAEEAFRTLLARWTLAPASNPDLTAARGALERLNGSANGSTFPAK